MYRLLFLILPSLNWLLSVVASGVSPLDHSIVKEPIYLSTPKYCMFTLGSGSDVRVWMVEDGRRLFVDKNANGDLTDDGQPLEPRKLRQSDTSHWDFEYSLPAITPANGSRHTSFILRRWNYDEKEDSYGLSLSVDGTMPMYAGWFGTFWSTDREQAPVIHFGGPFTPQLLRRKEITLGETKERLSLGFFHPGSGKGAVSRLSIEALPRSAVPRLTIGWPTTDGSGPLATSYELTQRCCYWEFYTTAFELPKGVVTGEAKITVTFPVGTTAIELTTTEMTIPVVAPLQGAAPAR
jgi:hypothetical protein